MDGYLCSAANPTYPSPPRSHWRAERCTGVGRKFCTPDPIWWARRGNGAEPAAGVTRLIGVSCCFQNRVLMVGRDDCEQNDRPGFHRRCRGQHAIVSARMLTHDHPRARLLFQPSPLHSRLPPHTAFLSPRPVASVFRASVGRTGWGSPQTAPRAAVANEQLRQPVKLRPQQIAFVARTGRIQARTIIQPVQQRKDRVARAKPATRLCPIQPRTAEPNPALGRRESVPVSRVVNPLSENARFFQPQKMRGVARTTTEIFLGLTDHRGFFTVNCHSWIG